MSKSIAAHYEPGPNWSEGRTMKEQPLKPHVDYMLSLKDKGKLVMGGPYTDDSGALVIFTVANQDEAEDLLSADPAIKSGIFKASLKDWNRIV